MKSLPLNRLCSVFTFIKLPLLHFIFITVPMDLFFTKTILFNLLIILILILNRSSFSFLSHFLLYVNPDLFLVLHKFGSCKHKIASIDK